MTLLIPCVLAVAAIALVIAAVVTAAERHRVLKDLCDCGVEASATVGEVRTRKGFTLGGFITVAGQPPDRRVEVTYRYADATGATHVGSFDAPALGAEGLAVVGRTFPVIYSSRNPAVSAQKHTVDDFRRASGDGRH